MVKSGDQLPFTLLVLYLLFAVATAATAALAFRLAWEETAWTLERGPQMVGFSLMHGPGAVLVLGPVGLIASLIGIVALTVRQLLRRERVSRYRWAAVATGIVVLASVSFPWGWLFIGKFAGSAHAAEIFVDDAAEGDLVTVRGFLAHGFPIDTRDKSKMTALHAAATAGQLKVVEYLVSHGANVNATDANGDSALERALANGQSTVAQYLIAHGAARIHRGNTNDAGTQ